MTRGLPGSGKSTWAAQQEGYVVVNKDDIRRRLEKIGWTWSHENEKQVIKIRDHEITAALRAGNSVISSDTNFGEHKQRLRELAELCGAEFEVKDFTNVPLQTCIERDAARVEGKVGAEVIVKMYHQYIAVPEVQKYEPKAGNPQAIICDLDGTLALHEGLRGPYDHAKAADDRVNEPIRDILWAFHRLGCHIIYVSGREDKWKPQTEEFLLRNNCPMQQLLMRKTGDFRKDYVAKQEIFDEHIRDKYNVKFVLDDRNQVVAMWRRLGLVCLQVNDGDF